MNMIQRTAERMILKSRVRGGATPQRIAKLVATIQILAIEDFSKARVVQCADEYTGRRFGEANCRFMQSVKLGSGGRNKGQTGYQVWVVWN